MPQCTPTQHNNKEKKKNECSVISCGLVDWAVRNKLEEQRPSLKIPSLTSNQSQVIWKHIGEKIGVH
jgi:hypothetical protein